MPNTPELAIAAARAQSENGPAFGYGLCLQRVRLCFDVDAMYEDATQAAGHADLRMAAYEDIPRGVPVWWTGGSAGHGHVAISTGDGYCWSTDFKRHGYFDKVRIGDITARWALKYVGWSPDINGVTVWEIQPTPVPDRLPNVERIIQAAKAGRDANKPGRLRHWFRSVLREARARR